MGFDFCISDTEKPCWSQSWWSHQITSPAGTSWIELKTRRLLAFSTISYTSSLSLFLKIITVQYLREVVLKFKFASLFLCTTQLNLWFWYQSNLNDCILLFANSCSSCLSGGLLQSKNLSYFSLEHRNNIYNFGQPHDWVFEKMSFLGNEKQTKKQCHCIA